MSIANQQLYPDHFLQDYRGVDPCTMLGRAHLSLNPQYPGLRCIHESPPIYLVDDFLTDAECSQLISVGAPLLQRSKTHGASGSEATKGRTSLTCHLAKRTQPCPQVLHKIAALTNKPVDHMEILQIARYTDNQRYVEHYDAVDPSTEAGRSFCMNGGQRVATVLIYLNHVEHGGSTCFPKLNLNVKPVKGTALIFFPAFLNGELDTDVLHAGMPAHKEVKWVSQVWIRQSYREDGHASMPGSLSDQIITGPLHEGIYRGHCVAGDDLHEDIMTFEEAKLWALLHPACQGFTFQHPDRFPSCKIRVWFKRNLRILDSVGWWSYSLGRHME